VYVNDLVYYHNSDRHFARKRSIFLTLQTVPGFPNRTGAEAAVSPCGRYAVSALAR
jgi:hypothetical protein